MVATFGPDGSLTCSGLPIVRYTHAELAAEFPGYESLSTSGEGHVKPWGTRQQFTAILLKREAWESSTKPRAVACSDRIPLVTRRVPRR